MTIKCVSCNVRIWDYKKVYYDGDFPLCIDCVPPSIRSFV